MSNNETIVKLNEALSKLITAYEKLQEENNVLNNQIEKLTLEKSSLMKEKESLEEDLSKYEDVNQQQNTNINSMLGKIESLLGHEKKSEMPSKYEEEEKYSAYSNPVSELTKDIPQKDEYETKSENSNNSSGKLDLNRMASLLNGLNK